MDHLSKALKFTVFYKKKNISKLSEVIKRSIMAHNINHIMNKKVMDRYMRLPLPCTKVLATYFWIDGSGINLRTKDRVLTCVPCDADAAPDWAFDGSSTGLASTDNSDTKLVPIAVYKDPFRMEPHVIIANEVYLGDGKTAPTNHRKFCNELCTIHGDLEPWLGLEQEYTMLDVDDWGVGWPKGGGFPAVKYEYSYCGSGAKYIAGRDVCESHARACLYSCLDFGGTNAEVRHASWEFQIGTSFGIRAPDDLWTARYILARVAEDHGVQITYHPKPFGKLHPGCGLHVNFSDKKMRTSPGGYSFIDVCVRSLERNHMKHMARYGMEEAANRLRLCGEFSASRFDQFTCGYADRTASVRLQRWVKERDQGFIEDRRPAADSDPYLVCGLILETCLGIAHVGGKPDMPPPCPPPCPCSYPCPYPCPFPCACPCSFQ